MSQPVLNFFALGVLLAVVGCSRPAPEKGRIGAEESAALEDCEQMILFSIDPEHLKSAREGAQRDISDGRLHDWKILGSVTADAMERDAIRKEFHKAMEDGGGIAGCFDPRHAIRMTRGKRTVDFVICFKCSQVYTYVFDGDRLISESLIVIFGTGDGFNEILTRHKVPLTEK